MRIERTVRNYNEVGYLVDFEYISYREIADCVANYKGWESFDYEHDDNFMQVWNCDDDDIITIFITDKDEED